MRCVTFLMDPVLFCQGSRVPDWAGVPSGYLSGLTMCCPTRAGSANPRWNTIGRYRNASLFIIRFEVYDSKINTGIPLFRKARNCEE